MVSSSVAYHVGNSNTPLRVPKATPVQRKKVHGYMGIVCSLCTCICMHVCICCVWMCVTHTPLVIVTHLCTHMHTHAHTTHHGHLGHSEGIKESKSMPVAMGQPCPIEHPGGMLGVHPHCCEHQKVLHIPPCQARPGDQRNCIKSPLVFPLLPSPSPISPNREFFLLHAFRIDPHSSPSTTSPPSPHL